MKSKKINKYIVCGVLLMSVRYMVEIPYNLACFATGAGVSLVGFGIYVMNNDITKLKNWKKRLIKKIMNEN